MPSDPVDHRQHHVRFVVVFTLVTSCLAARPDALRLLNEAGVSAGVAVHVGSTDGLLEAGWASTEHLLVHGLALDDASRDRARATIMNRGLYGLATVVTWHDRTRLPYATNLANLVLLDRDALGEAAPGPDEVLRVLAPYGVAYVHREGAWRRLVKPRPDAMDDWTHFDYGPHGSPCSEDKAVTPPRQLKWITQAQPNPFEGNPAGYDPGAGVRIWRQYAILDINHAYDAAGDRRRKPDMWSLECRNAFNGIPLWTVRRGRLVGTRRWSLVAADGFVFTYLEPGGELCALDIASGEVKHSFAGTAAGDRGPREETHCVRFAVDSLVVTAAGKLLCFEPQTGKPSWSFGRDGKRLLAPTVDSHARRVFALIAAEAPEVRRVFGGRWPSSTQVESVVALDLSTGEPIWESRDERIVSRDLGQKRGKPVRRGIGQVVPCGEYVLLFGSAAISGGAVPFVGTLAAGTGRTLDANDEPYIRTYNRAGYNLLVRDGKAYFAGAFMNIWQYEPSTGEIDLLVNYSWNQRCTRLTATSNYLLFGQAGYFQADGSGEQVTVARSGCALGIFPANGLSYFTPNACGCITQLRGFNALTGEEVRVPLKEVERRKGGAPPVKLPRAARNNPAGLVAADWTKHWRTGALETAAVAAGSVLLSAVTHQHRLEARAADGDRWTFVADGRISSPPVVWGDTAYFGDHAGWVYAVAVDGSLRWKHLVAPTHRLVSSNGQLESAWPVYGVTIFDDQLIASAGTHVGIGGGVWVTALRPATGEALWRKRIYLQPNWVPPGGKGAIIVDHTFVNTVPRVEGRHIVLGEGGRKGGQFRFSPKASSEELAEQLMRAKSK